MELEGSRRPPAPWIDSIRAQGRGEGGEDRRRKAGDLVLRNGTAGGLLSLRAELEVASHSSGEESKVPWVDEGGRQVEYFGGSHFIAFGCPRTTAAPNPLGGQGRAVRRITGAAIDAPTPARRLHGEGKGTADRDRNDIGFWSALG